MIDQLAINGGKKIRTRKFPSNKVIGKQEELAVTKVLRGNILSQFLGTGHKYFYGGPEILALEKDWAKYFKVKHAIAVNSCTSGLYCAVGACGIGPGDEVIVSPYSMSASVTGVLIFNSIPVFADIEKDYFCIDPESVKRRITRRTKAIIAVDIFGQPYDVEKINALAKKHHLYVIEDCAQAPGAKYKNKYAGSLGDIGIYSLNYHKHIHTGEGGIVVTNNDNLAQRVRLIRNHAEVVVKDMGITNLVNMIGFNFRMTEIEAAIARCQLKKLNKLINKIIYNAGYLTDKLDKIPGIISPKVRNNCKHVYYTQAYKFNESIIGVSRDKFVKAVKAELMPNERREEEGVLIGCGYVSPIYLEPIFQKTIGYGNKGCPFKCPWYKGTLDYHKGIDPVVEQMFEKELFTIGLINPAMRKDDLDDVIEAFNKVYRLRKTIN